MRIADTLLDLLFPPKCPFCQKVQDAPEICPDCGKSLPWTDEAHGLRELPRRFGTRAPSGSVSAASNFMAA